MVSAVEVDSGHPNAGATGHGVASADTVAAWREVQSLLEADLLQRVPEEMLAETEERMKYEGLWAHFWCWAGLGHLLKRYVSEADAQLHLGLRADKLSLQADGQVAVWGTARAPGRRAWAVEAKADVVILAVPAPEALRLLPDLPCPVANTLSQIQYDSRTAIAISFDPALQEAVARRFAGVAEVALDVYAPGEVHLVSWQNLKDHSLAHGDAVRIVVHSVASAAVANGRAAALQALSAMLGLSATLLDGLVLECKVVDWQICQMVRPFESVLTELELLEPAFLHEGAVVIAGDFWCQSSFLGCFCSASAAVRQALRVLAEPAS